MNNPFTEEEKTRTQKEYRLQVHIAKKHSEYFPNVMMTHVPNKGKGGADGFFKKQMGVKAGVSDIALWWKAQPEKHLLHAGMVELKVDTGVSPDQNKWMSAFWGIGGYEGVARSWQQYYKLLCSWGIKPKQECAAFDEPDYRSDQQKFHDSFEFYRP